MEALTRLVSESLARYGLDRPVDYRRLQWSRWFRCESLHSLLHVPSKPGIFALAEEIVSFREDREGHDFSRAVNEGESAALAAEGRRMLSVLQFHEADDMAFVLDRMLSRQNPMSARLASGKCFVRFVAIEDEIQRRSICNSLNQWLVATGEKVSGIGAHFATSDDRVARTPSSATASTGIATTHVGTDAFDSLPRAQSRGPASEESVMPQLDSGAGTNLHCPQPFPSGF